VRWGSDVCMKHSHRLIAEGPVSLASQGCPGGVPSPVCATCLSAPYQGLRYHVFRIFVCSLSASSLDPRISTLLGRRAEARVAPRAGEPAAGRAAAAAEPPLPDRGAGPRVVRSWRGSGCARRRKAFQRELEALCPTCPERGPYYPFVPLPIPDSCMRKGSSASGHWAGLIHRPIS